MAQWHPLCSIPPLFILHENPTPGGQTFVPGPACYPLILSLCTNVVIADFAVEGRRI